MAGSQVEKLFVLLIESGAVYCAIWVSQPHFTSGLSSMEIVNKTRSECGLGVPSQPIQVVESAPQVTISPRTHLLKHLCYPYEWRTRARDCTSNFIFAVLIKIASPHLLTLHV